MQPTKSNIVNMCVGSSSESNDAIFFLCIVYVNNFW